jgi:hypothetical protein
MNGTPQQIVVSLGISKRFCVEDMEPSRGIKNGLQNLRR